MQTADASAANEEPPKEYEVFLDIKKSYETSLARMDILVKKLQNENRIEKTKRLKFQKIAEEIQDRESKIVNTLKSRYNTELTKEIEENRAEIAKEYQFALDSQKAMVKQQMEKMVGQSSIIKKLCETITQNETALTN